MRSTVAFIKKEILEQLRSGKLVVIGILFVMFGIMNPAVAKLTPFLLEMMSESLAESGMTITVTSVSAMDSWVQFFKNIPIALIVFVLLQGGILTREYESGTLVLSLTKGLRRFKVILSKALMLTVLWTVGYWICFLVTYGYNAYFWDNSVAKSLGFSAVCWWLFGLFTVSLIVLLSAAVRSNTGVFLGTGGAVLAMYLVGLIPKAEKYVPTLLTDGVSLIYGVSGISGYVASLVITAVATAVCFAVSVPIFNKKQM